MKLILGIGLLFWASLSVSTSELKLPDLGNPSDRVLSEDDEQRYRVSIRQQMYQYDFVMTDPVVAAYITNLGYRLASFSNRPSQSFDFFVVPADVINAAAYPGGLIVLYSGLFLETDTESELAGVLAHEIAHVNQRHISRMMAKQQKSTAPILLGMLAAVAAAQSSSSGDAPIAIAASMQALQQQLAINFTRYHEYEADRVGIKTLYEAGLNPAGMAGFFSKLMQKHRVDPRYQIPEYLRTHPLSVNRVTEAKNRMKTLPAKPYHESELYPYIKERLRVMTADEFIDLHAYYEGALQTNIENSGALRYGQALFHYHNNDYNGALSSLGKIELTGRNTHLVKLLQAQVMAHVDRGKAKSMVESLLKLYPDNSVVLQTGAEILMQSKEVSWQDDAIRYLRQLLLTRAEDPMLHDMLSIAYYNAMKPVQSGESMARKEHLMGRNYRAVRILRNLMKDDDLDYYQSAEINALIAQYEPLITDKERQAEIAADRGLKR